MTYMQCPICRKEVIGSGVDELSQALTVHLRDGHGMTELPSPREGMVLRPAYGEHDKDSMGTWYAEPGTQPALVPEEQEVTDFAVRCPFCRTLVAGRSETDLGEQVREHWSSDHGLRLRTRLPTLGPLGGRRG